MSVDVFALLMHLLSRACELTLLRPLWQLFMTMENGLNQDPTSVTVLLPLHRALTELFFIAEAHAGVSDVHPVAVVTSHDYPCKNTAILGDEELFSLEARRCRCLLSCKDCFHDDGVGFEG